MKQIPFVLIYTRLLTGLLLVAFSYLHIAHYALIAVILLVFGLLTDVFDGIIARRFGVSTQKLRTMDSTVDLLFFSCIGIATYLQHPGFFSLHALELVVLLSSEILTYVFCVAKFRRVVATHSLGAKIWTLFLVAALIEIIIITGNSGLLFACCFWFGLLTRLEIIGIVLVLKKWESDIPTIYHAVQSRRGLVISRNKWFNG